MSARVGRWARAATLAVALIFDAGCHRDVPSSGAGPDGGATTSGPEPNSACVTRFDFLVPFQKYGSSDLIRAIAVDGDEVYFRTYHETFRVPLSGGAPGLLSKAEEMEGPLWIIGDHLVTQPMGQPAFMAIAKTGGTWTTLLDASAAKHVGPSVTRRIFQSIGSGHIEAAKPAIFDGTRFFWIEEDTDGASLGKKGTAAWHVRTISASGGSAETLYTTKLELRGLTLAHDTLLFEQGETEPKPPPPGTKKPLFEPVVWSLWTMPAGGGKAEMRMNPYFGSDPTTDGTMLYFSGFRDLSTYGTWRMPVNGNAAPERIDPLVIDQKWGGTYGGDKVVFHAAAMISAPRPGFDPGSERYLLIGSPNADKLERIACFEDRYAVHAYAVVGKTLLLSILRGGDGFAGIAKVLLP